MEMDDEAAEDEMEVKNVDVEPFPRGRSNTWHGSHAAFGDHKPKFAAISEKSTSLNQNEDEDDYLGHSEVLTFEHHSSNDPSLNEFSDHLSATPTARRNSIRRNAWGNASYADLITQAIESVPDKRLTLMQIYDWMIQNIPYFHERADGANSMGWKNSVRHNLSLHDQFSRIQNEGTGKSSWWIVNKSLLKSRLPRTRRATMGDTILMDKKRIKVSKNLKRMMGYTSSSTLNSEDKNEDVAGEGMDNNYSSNVGDGASLPINENKVKIESKQSLLDNNYMDDEKSIGFLSGSVVKKIRTTSDSNDNSLLHCDGLIQQGCSNQRRSSFTVSSSSNDFENDEMIQKQQLKKAHLINALLNRHRIKSSLMAQQKQQQLHQQQQQFHQQLQHSQSTPPATVSYVVCSTMPLTIQQGQLCLAMSSFNSNNNLAQHPSQLQIQSPTIQFQPSPLQIQHQQLQFQSQPLQLQAQPVGQIQLQVQSPQLQIQQQQLQLQPQHLQIQPQQVQFQSHQLLLQPQMHLQPQVQQQPQVANNIILNVQPSNNQIQPVNMNATNNGRPIVLYVTTSKNSISHNQSQSSQFVLTRRQSLDDPKTHQSHALLQSSQNTSHLAQHNMSADSQIIKYINTDLNKQALNMTLTDEMALNQDEHKDCNFFQQQQQEYLYLHQHEHQSQALNISEKRQKMLLDLLHSEKFCEMRRKNPEFNNKIVEILKKKKEMLEASASGCQPNLDLAVGQEHFTERFNENAHQPEQNLHIINNEFQQQQQHFMFHERQQRQLDMVNDYISTLSPADNFSDGKSFRDDTGREQHQAISSSSIVTNDNLTQKDGDCGTRNIEDERLPTTTSLNDDDVNRVIEGINFEENIDELFDVSSLLNCDDELSQAFPPL